MTMQIRNQCQKHNVRERGGERERDWNVQYYYSVQNSVTMNILYEQAHTRARAHTHTHTHTHTCMHSRNGRTYTHTHTCMHSRNARTHTHTHTHMRARAHAPRTGTAVNAENGTGLVRRSSNWKWWMNTLVSQTFPPESWQITLYTSHTPALRKRKNILP